MELVGREPGWTILSQKLAPSEERLYEVAKEIVLRGPGSAIRNVPVERIGPWFSVDRTDIESIRSLRNIMTGYLRAEARARPLSIGVFGPPGSGKSFAVRQLTKTLLPTGLADLEFNLSQFSGPDELPAAFHQIRDAVLRGELPVVFWDEFDVPLEEPLGWLRYFLAPMQDGEFREGTIRHPLGRAIFVFAGGIHHTMQDFRDLVSPEDAPPSKEMIRRKAPDFLSRLSGYLDVLGPNPRDSANPLADRAYMLRRALILRTLLERNTQPSRRGSLVCLPASPTVQARRTLDGSGDSDELARRESALRTLKPSRSASAGTARERAGVPRPGYQLALLNWMPTSSTR